MFKTYLIRKGEYDMDYEWYVNLMNFLDKRAKENCLLSRFEIMTLNNALTRYDVADNFISLIHDIADANDCGICNSWNDLIIALRKLHEVGDRIEIEK